MSKLSKSTIETIKTVVIAVLVTAIIAFIAGNVYANKQHDTLESAVHNAVSNGSTAPADVKK